MFRLNFGHHQVFFSNVNACVNIKHHILHCGIKESPPTSAQTRSVCAITLIQTDSNLVYADSTILKQLIQSSEIKEFKFTTTTLQYVVNNNFHSRECPVHIYHTLTSTIQKRSIRQHIIIETPL